MQIVVLCVTEITETQHTALETRGKSMSGSHELRQNHEHGHWLRHGHELKHEVRHGHRPEHRCGFGPENGLRHAWAWPPA